MQQYERLSHVEHILKRPDTYVGSLGIETGHYWVRGTADNFEFASLQVSPGLVKIFDEILVNAIDQYSLGPKKVTSIEVRTLSNGSISVTNSGVFIPLKMHETENIWIPELIFGHLLTSSNYNDDEQRVTGGRNGYGCLLYTSDAADE